MFMMMNLFATIFQSRQVIKLVNAIFVVNRKLITVPKRFNIADIKAAIFVSLSKVTLCTLGTVTFLIINVT